MGPSLGDPKRDHNFDNPPCTLPFKERRSWRPTSRPELPRSSRWMLCRARWGFGLKVLGLYYVVKGFRVEGLEIWA